MTGSLETLCSRPEWRSVDLVVRRGSLLRVLRCLTLWAHSLARQASQQSHGHRTWLRCWPLPETAGAKRPTMKGSAADDGPRADSQGFHAIIAAPWLEPASPHGACFLNHRGVWRIRR